MKLKSILLGASAIMVAGSSFGQSNVATGGVKHVLLEEGTGTWCGWCPDGAQRIQETVEPTYPNCIAISFHNGDGMALSPDVFNSAYITGFPGAAVDRKPFTHPNPSTGVLETKVNVNRGYWAGDVGVRDAIAPRFDVSMTSTFDSVTRIVSIAVKGKALVAATGSFRINAYITEDSIIAAAPNDQDSYLNTSSGSWYMGKGSPISPSSWYAHMGVVRKILATGGNMYGDAAFTNPAVGDSVTKTYTYTIPATMPFKYVKVVGLVQKYGTTTDDREIENSIRAKVRTMWKVLPTTGISTVSTMQDIELFPNPAANYIRIEGSLPASVATKVTITNLVGQVMSVNEYPAGSTMFAASISLANFSNGVYFMNITNNGSSVTKQFAVNK